MNVLVRILLPLAFIASGILSLGGIIRITRADHLMVRNDDEYQTLIADINNRYMSNVFWRLSFSRIRSIKAADEWWQRCVNYLIIWCDVIVVDLTVVKAGTLWELEKIRDDGLSYKAVFIVHEDAYEKGRQYLTRYWLPNDTPFVFRYSSRGRLLEEEPFLIRVARIRSSSQPR